MARDETAERTSANADGSAHAHRDPNPMGDARAGSSAFASDQGPGHASAHGSDHASGPASDHGSNHASDHASARGSSHASDHASGRAWPSPHGMSEVAGEGLGPRVAHDRDEPHHPVRVKIQAYVQDHPGVHMGDLVRTLHLGWGNAHHHLDHMERRHQILREPEGNRVRLFVPGQVPRQLRHGYAVLRNDSLRATFRVIMDQPGIIQRDVAAALGVTATAARKHLRRLTAEGLIRTERKGNRVRYRVAADPTGLELRMWLRSGRLPDEPRHASQAHAPLTRAPAATRPPPRDADAAPAEADSDPAGRPRSATTPGGDGPGHAPTGDGAGDGAADAHQRDRRAAGRDAHDT